MLFALEEAFTAIAHDDSIRVVILAAEGKAFSAGHDLKEMQSYRVDADDGRNGNRRPVLGTSAHLRVRPARRGTELRHANFDEDLVRRHRGLKHAGEELRRLNRPLSRSPPDDELAVERENDGR